MAAQDYLSVFDTDATTKESGDQQGDADPNLAQLASSPAIPPASDTTPIPPPPTLSPTTTGSTESPLVPPPLTGAQTTTTTTYNGGTQPGLTLEQYQQSLNDPNSAARLADSVGQQGKAIADLGSLQTMTDAQRAAALADYQQRFGTDAFAANRDFDWTKATPEDAAALERYQYLSTLADPTTSARIRQFMLDPSYVAAAQPGGVATSSLPQQFQQLLAPSAADARTGGSMATTPSTAGTAATPSATTLGTRVPLSPIVNAAGAAGSGAGSAPAGPYSAKDVAIGSTVLPNASSRLTGLQSLVDAQTGKLAAVDRTKLAQDMFDQFAQSTDPAYQLALRRATEAGAHAGRIGSGQLRTSYGDLAHQRAQELDLAKRGFMSDALKGSIEDEFNKFGALTGREGQLYGQEAATRNELRGERGYQGSLEEQAYQRALDQYLTEQQAVDSRFRRGAQELAIGDTGNPSSYYEQMANQIDPAMWLQLLQSLGSGTGSRTAPTTTTAGRTTTAAPNAGTIAPDLTIPPGYLPA